jgi:hypothetical protein
MDKKRLQQTALSTILFAIVFALFLTVFNIVSIESTEGKIAAIITGSLVFFGVSYFFGKKKR